MTDHEQTTKAYTALLTNLRDAWAAMALLREAVETLAPVGAMRSSEIVACQTAPTFDAEAQELVKGIIAIYSASERQAA